MNIEASTTTTTSDRSVEIVERLLKLPKQTRLDLGNLLLDSVRHGFTSLAEAQKKDKELISSRLEELVSGKPELIDAKVFLDELEGRIRAETAK